MAYYNYSTNISDACTCVDFELYDDETEEYYTVPQTHTLERDPGCHACRKELFKKLDTYSKAEEAAVIVDLNSSWYANSEIPLYTEGIVIKADIQRAEFDGWVMVDFFTDTDILGHELKHGRFVREMLPVEALSIIG